jgi:hypothetical protein
MGSTKELLDIHFLRDSRGREASLEKYSRWISVARQVA